MTTHNSVKPNLSVSERSGFFRHNTHQACQKYVRKSNSDLPDTMIETWLSANLRQMVARLSVGGKVQAYEEIASQLSKLAGLNNGHSWGWRYVASVQSGSTLPSKKFARACDLYFKKITPRQKQWFYFSRRRSVVSIYDKAILSEIIQTHMRAMGYKPVTYSRYMEVKKLATKKGKKL